MGFEPLGGDTKPIVSSRRPDPEPGLLWFDTSPDNGIDWYVAESDTEWTRIAGTSDTDSDVDVSDSNVAVAHMGDD